MVYRSVYKVKENKHTFFFTKRTHYRVYSLVQPANIQLGKVIFCNLTVHSVVQYYYIHHFL